MSISTMLSNDCAKLFTTAPVFCLQVYEGKVTNILNFGCFVQLEGLRKRLEGLVHISQLRREGRVTSVADVVTRGQKVKVTAMAKSSSNICRVKPPTKYTLYIINVPINKHF